MTETAVTKVKKPRSEAQISAFEKARAAREANLKKKFLAEQESEKEKGKDETVPEKEEDDAETEPENPPSKRISAGEALGFAAPEEQEETDDEHEAFDPNRLRDEIYEQLKSEMDELREHVTGVKRKQEDLQSDWSQHRVRSHNGLNFV